MNGKAETTLAGRLKKHIKNIEKITKLTGDASIRDYYRIFTGSGSLVAMVYPCGNSEEINRIRAYTDLYRRNGMHVPKIIDQIGDDILIQDDIGDISLQQYFSESSEDDLLKVKVAIDSILEQLKSIPPEQTLYIMDDNKIEFEINFFIKNFVKKLIPGWEKHDELFEEIIKKLNSLDNKRFFAHRDFHSRNIFIKGEDLFLIDFQDSLQAPEHYDAVSFVFDSYMKPEHSAYFFSLFNDRDDYEMEQIYLTAYQRNIKALGTFGYQNDSGNKNFFNYIKPTINNLRRNIFYSEESLLGMVFSQFERTLQA